MKFVRYGAPGREKPGMLDADGRIRDLSNIVPDIAGAVLTPAGLNKLRKHDPEKLPLVRGKPRLGACVGKVGNFIAVGFNYVDHAAESVIQPRLNTVNRVFADEPLGLAKVHHRQPGGFGEETCDRHPDTRADHAAQVLGAGGDNIEVDRCSEIYHHRRAAITMKRSDAVDDPIRAHFARIVVENLQADVRIGGHE